MSSADQDQQDAVATTTGDGTTPVRHEQERTRRADAMFAEPPLRYLTPLHASEEPYADDVLALAAAAEADSEHPLAKAIVRAASALRRAQGALTAERLAVRPASAPFDRLRER